MFTRKDLVKLIIPLIIEQVLGATIGIADTLMVAIAGEAVVSGVSLVDTLNILLINVFSAFATGGAIITSQYLGRGDEKGANTAAKQLVIATTIVSLVLMVICLPSTEGILRLIYGNTEADVMQSAKDYFFYSALSYPFIASYNACTALFRSMNNTKVTMFTSGLINIVNVGGNALFIFGFGMGAAGAALASLISRMLGTVILFILLSGNGHVIHFDSFFPLRFDGGMIKNILRIGVPNGLENSMFQIGKILVQGIVASFGTTAIAANAVAGSVASIAMMPGSAIGLATLTVVGRCIGAKDYKQAGGYMLKLTWISQAIVAGVNGLILVAMNPILTLYDLTPETAALAKQLLICACVIGILFWSVSFTLPNGLRAANDVKFTMIIAIISMWVFRVGFGYVCSFWLGAGALGVWIGMGADWMFRLIVFIIRYISGRWKNRQII